MPKIEQYTRRNLPTAVSRVRATQDSFGSGAGLAQAGQMLEEYAFKRAEREYISKMSEFELENTKVLNDLQRQDFDPEADLSEIYAKNVEERASQLEVSPLMRDRYSEDLNKMRFKFSTAGLEETIRREGVRAQEAWENTLVNAENMISLGGSLEAAKDIIYQAEQTLPRMSSEDRSVLMDDALDRLDASLAAKTLADNPYEFKRMAKSGQFNDLKNLGTYLEKADNEIEALQKKAKEKADLAAILEKGLIDPQNKTHKKAVDTLYSQMQMDDGGNINELLSQGNLDAANVSLQLVSKYKYVPEDLQSTLRSMMSSGDEDQKAFAYKLAGQFDEVGATGLSDTEKKDAKSFLGLTSAGISDKQALESIKMIRSPEHAKQVEVHKAQLKELETKPEDAIKGAFGKGIFNFAPAEVSAQAVYDYDTVFRSEFLKFGNEQAAKEVALRVVQDKYKQSELLGEEKVMPYAPEYYGHPELSPKENRKWMRRELKKELKQQNMNIDNVSLVPIPENDELVATGAQPIYYIIDEQTNDYARTEDNQKKLMYFDPSKAELPKKRQMRELNAQERAKELRRVLSDPNSTMLDKILARQSKFTFDAAQGLIEVFD